MLPNEFLKNSSKIISSEIEDYLKNWHLPNVKLDNINKIGMFYSESRKIVKTVEQTIPIRQEYETLRLFDPGIVKYKENYKFLHISLLQIALKPLTNEGLNAYTLIELRHYRHLNFADSLLGLIESSLCNGPHLAISILEN